MSEGKGCKKKIWRGFHAYPCGRRVVGDHGFCGIHSPEAVAKRNVKSDAKWNEKREAWIAADKRRDAERHALDVELPALLSALEEIRDTVNDPRAIAIRALERHAKGGKG